MGVIVIHFLSKILDLYESEVVRVTDRTITNINKEMSEKDIKLAKYCCATLGR